MNKTTIIAMVVSFVKSPENISVSESEVEIRVAEDIESPLSLQEKPNRAINDEINAEIAGKARTIKDITGVLKKELINFEIEGKRGPNLERCYNDLKMCF